MVELTPAAEFRARCLRRAITERLLGGFDDAEINPEQTVIDATSVPVTTLGRVQNSQRILGLC
jgi:hypothetical protein